MDNWKTLYESSQSQRLHWSSMITTLMGFVISANVIVWVYAFSNYLPTLGATTNKSVQQPIFIFIAAIASAISLSLWRLYTHYLDNCITQLYPEIIYYEAKLGIIEDYGLGGYLVNELGIEKIINRDMSPEKRSQAVSNLVRTKRIGDRKHKWFDIGVVLLIIIFIGLCILAESLTGEFFNGTYGWLHIICIGFVFMGLIISSYASYICPRNPAKGDIDSALCDMKQIKPVVDDSQIMTPESNQSRCLMSKDSNDFSIEQYKQVYEDQRQLWIVFWQIPTVAVTIATGIFAIVFINFWGHDWLAAGILFLVSHIITIVLAFVALKHRYFGHIWAGTLAKMENENELFIKRSQRTAFPEKEIKDGKDIWFEQKPNWYAKPSGERLLVGALLIMSFISVVLTMIAFFNFNLCLFCAALPGWLIVITFWFYMSSRR